MFGRSCGLRARPNFHPRVSGDGCGRLRTAPSLNTTEPNVPMAYQASGCLAAPAASVRAPCVHPCVPCDVRDRVRTAPFSAMKRCPGVRPRMRLARVRVCSCAYLLQPSLRWLDGAASPCSRAPCALPHAAAPCGMRPHVWLASQAYRRRAAAARAITAGLMDIWRRVIPTVTTTTAASMATTESATTPRTALLHEEPRRRR